MKLDPAAKADQSQLDKVNQQQQKLDAADDAAGGGSWRPRESRWRRRSSRSTSRRRASSSSSTSRSKLASSPATDTRLTDLENAIKKTPGVKSVSPATLDKKGTAGVFTAVPTTAPSDEKTEDLVEHLRDDVIPDATQGKGDDGLRRRPDRRATSTWPTGSPTSSRR